MRARWILSRLWADVPLWTFGLYAVLIAHAEARLLAPPRPDLVWTFVFPWSVIVAVQAVRWPRATAAERALGTTLTLLVPAAVAVGAAVAPSTPLAADRLRLVGEWIGLGGFGLLLLHAWSRERRLLAFLLLPTALYGIVLENGGVLLGYFREPGYALTVPFLPAPPATTVGWPLVLYVAIFAIWDVRRHAPAIGRTATSAALLATLVALLYDLQVDPYAVTAGLWIWDARFPPGPLGVPLVNFVAWACAVFPFAWAVFHRERALGLGPTDVARGEHVRWLLVRLPLVLAASAALFLVSSLVIEGGTSGPSWEVLRRALAVGR